jgi:predicted neuraminidase
MIPPPPLEPPAVRFVPAPSRINHGAGLLRLASGDLLACWYSGKTEAGPDAVILCARSRDQGANWAPPTRVSRPHERAAGAPRPAKSVGNVVLAADPAGRVVMVSGEIQSRRWLGVEVCRTWRCGRIDFRISVDQGLSWSPPTRLDDRPGALPRGRPLRMADGTDRLPIYREGRGASVISLDLAALKPGVAPAIRLAPIPAAETLIQPSLVPPGRDPANGAAQPLRAYLRDPHRLFVYLSSYHAATGAWSRAAPTDLQNPASAVEAFRDGRGRTVLIHNPGREDRRTLRLDVSSDGVHFPAGCDLVRRGALGEVAYPAVAEMGAGRWGVAFSANGKRRIAFLRLDQARIDACAASPR